MQVQKAAVIGHPIGHTMSPFIHRRLFQLEGIPFVYQVLDVPAVIYYISISVLFVFLTVQSVEKRRWS